MSKPAANLKQFADLEGQYEILKQLGEGAYGVVAAAKDKASGDKVAIKRIKDAVEDKEQVLPYVLSRERQCQVASVVDAAFGCRYHLIIATDTRDRWMSTLPRPGA
jgi:serine/threonine protein kinase